LKNFVIPSSINIIGNNVFDGCTGLTNINTTNIQNSFIGVSMFNGCSNITNITIPDYVTSVGTSAFQGCTGLTSITLNRDYSQGLTTLSSNSFLNTPNINSIPSLRQMCFNGYPKQSVLNAGFTTSRVNIAFGGIVLDISDNIITGASYPDSTLSGQAIIPNTVTAISIGAFNSVSQYLTEVTTDNVNTRLARI
jgi:hypothetical protein